MQVSLFLSINSNSTNFSNLNSFRNFLQLKWKQKLGSVNFPSVFCIFYTISGDNFNLFLGWEQKFCKDNLPVSQISDFFNEEFDVVSLTIHDFSNPSIKNAQNSQLMSSFYQDFYKGFGSITSGPDGDAYVFNIIRKYEISTLGGSDSRRFYTSQFLSYFFGDFFVPFYFDNKELPFDIWKKNQVLSLIERYARHFFFVLDIAYSGFCFHLTVEKKLVIYLLFQTDHISFDSKKKDLLNSVEIKTAFDKSIFAMLKNKIKVNSFFLIDEKSINLERHIFDIVLSDFVKESYISNKSSLIEQYKSVFYRLTVDSKDYLRGQFSVNLKEGKQYSFYSTKLLVEFRLYVFRKIKYLIKSQI